MSLLGKSIRTEYSLEGLDLAFENPILNRLSKHLSTSTEFRISNGFTFCNVLTKYYTHIPALFTLLTDCGFPFSSSWALRVDVWVCQLCYLLCCSAVKKTENQHWMGRKEKEGVLLVG